MVDIESDYDDSIDEELDAMFEFSQKRSEALAELASYIDQDPRKVDDPTIDKDMQIHLVYSKLTTLNEWHLYLRYLNKLYPDFMGALLIYVVKNANVFRITSYSLFSPS